MRYIALDFETYLISAEAPIPKPVCLSYYSDGEAGLAVGYNDMEELIGNALNGGCPIIAHNASFEALVIQKYFPVYKEVLDKAFNEGRIVCTKVYEQLINNTRKKPINRFDLASLVLNYLDEDISECKSDPNAWRMRYSELDGICKDQWPKEAIDYAISDSIYAYRVYEEQLETPVDIQISTSADYYLNLMAIGGMLIDQSKVKSLEKEILDIIIPEYEALLKLNFVVKVSVNKYKKKMILFREYIKEHVSGHLKTKTGKVATGKADLCYYLTLTEPLTDVHIVLSHFIKIAENEKILTAFISRLKLANPYIRTRYKAVISSGRTSSSGDKSYPSVNIQQMPREVKGVNGDIRGCYIPRPGHKICTIDYAGLELASAAHQLFILTGKDSMLKLINSGKKPVDLHSIFACQLMNLKEKTKETYESFVAKKKKSPYKEYRQLAKPINLGFPGGIGYDVMRENLAKEGIYPKLVILETVKYEDTLTWKRTLGRKQGYPVRIRRIGKYEYQLVYDELYLLKQELFKLYPDLQYFLTQGHLQYMTGHTKPVKNKFGEWEEEPMYSYDVYNFKRDWCIYMQACNGILMQSPTAVGAKQAMVDIIQKGQNSMYYRPLAFIHDEIVFEVVDNPEIYPIIIKDISEMMIDAMQSVLTSVRITVEAEVFDYWAKSGGFYEATYWKNAKDSVLYSDED